MTADLPTPISTEGPPIDVPLLRKAVEWAEAEAAKPEAESEWFQPEIVRSGASLGRTCGTCYCILGYVESIDRSGRFGGDTLGLTPDESSALFYRDNSITDVRTAAERIAARAGERL